MLNLLIFFAGVLTSITIVVIIRLYNKRSRAKRLVMRQSDLYNIIKTYLPSALEVYKYNDTQALSYEDSKVFRYIEMPDQKAYWLDKNTIYYTDIKNGLFDPAKAKPLPSKNLSEEQLSHMLLILNNLTIG